MCFTPFVSLSTAIIEFAVATYILFAFRKSIVTVFSAVFIYVLGLYQFTEFMLCTSNQAVLWAIIGFITYTFLPAIALHFAICFTKKKFNIIFIYALPVIFSITAMLKSNFIISASCSTIFIKVETLFFSSTAFVRYFYWVYYSGTLLIVCILLYQKINKIKNKIVRMISFLVIFIIFITLALPVILILILPQLGIMFPSIYCEFAVLFAIAVLIASRYYDHKNK